MCFAKISHHSVLKFQHGSSFRVPFKHRHTQAKCLCDVVLYYRLQLFVITNQNHLFCSRACDGHEWFRLHAHATFIDNALLDVVARRDYPRTSRSGASTENDLNSRLLKSPLFSQSNDLEGKKFKKPSSVSSDQGIWYLTGKVGSRFTIFLLREVLCGFERKNKFSICEKNAHWFLMSLQKSYMRGKLP